MHNVNKSNNKLFEPKVIGLLNPEEVALTAKTVFLCCELSLYTFLC